MELLSFPLIQTRPIYINGYHESEHHKGNQFEDKMFQMAGIRCSKWWE